MSGAKMPKITGYRELTDAEIKTINLIKEEENVVDVLIDSLLIEGEADKRWLAIARTQLQQGFMAMTRAVAKPEGF